MLTTQLMLSLIVSTNPAPDVLRFTVDVQSNRGQVLCAAYDAESKWLSTDVVDGTIARIVNGKAVCVFRGLKPGRYAISAYHDEDGDEELDTNFLGIPSEDYCASRNARASFGPPAFADAAFRYAGGVLELSARAE